MMRGWRNGQRKKLGQKRLGTNRGKTGVDDSLANKICKNIT